MNKIELNANKKAEIECCKMQKVWIVSLRQSGYPSDCITLSLNLDFAVFLSNLACSMDVIHYDTKKY